MAGGYKALEAGVGNLKNLSPLVDDADDGITQDDLDLAEANAKARIDAELAALYDVSGWAASTPPIIALIADKLSSAEVLTNKFARDSGGAAVLSEVLQREAQEFIDRIKRGSLTLLTPAAARVASTALRTPVVNND